MAIVNSVQRVMAGFGAGSGGPGAVTGGYVTASAVALTPPLTATAVTMGTQGYSNGKVRIHVYNGGGANTTVTISVTVTDGTTCSLSCR